GLHAGRAYAARALQADREGRVARRARSAPGGADRPIRLVGAADEDAVRGHVVEAARAAARRGEARGRAGRGDAARAAAGECRSDGAHADGRGPPDELRARWAVQAEVHGPARV